jgi:fumarylacetoacetase
LEIPQSTISWLDSANAHQADFPIYNLPYGVFDAGAGARIGIAIGDRVFDLKACVEVGLLDGLDQRVLGAIQLETLNTLMSLGPIHWSSLRKNLVDLLRVDALGATRQRVQTCLVPMRDAEMKMPAAIGDYTDFFTSLFHATNAGTLFRPDNPVWPNYKYVPIGYHGRASSVVLSGTAVRRPKGQRKPNAIDAPVFEPCRALDYEMEVGLFVGPGNALGEPVPIGEADQHMFGVCLLNDWSARDIQSWEYQPLGPFLAKSFVTSISPWVVTMEALEPFRTPAFSRAADDPTPLPYLSSPEDQARGGIDLTVEVWLQSRQMREKQIAPMRVSQGHFRDMYWTVAQMLAHHTSNGCNLRPGDLFGSGTISGATPDSLGCLLEITRGGANAFQLPSGEERRYLEDGDEVILRGCCKRGEPGAEGYLHLGFGECRGTVLPSS